MKKKQHSVRWEGWLFNAIEEWRIRNGHKSFSDSVNYLLACELNRYGYEREFFEQGIYENIKLKNIKKELSSNIVAEIEEKNLNYDDIVLKFNVILKNFADKAFKNDTKLLHIPEFDKEKDYRLEKNPKPAELKETAEPNSIHDKERG